MAWSLLPLSLGTFNWPWVVGFVVCILLVTWFLFYFNRFCGAVISFLIRTYTWHQYRAWIDIGAIQFSLLGGRIFFKQLRYHAANETILIQQGYITWRYWNLHSRQIDLSEPSKPDSQESDLNDDDSEESVKSSKKTRTPEARLAINVTGLEWFVYNRTPAYDAIIAANAAAVAAAANNPAQGDPSWRSKEANEASHSTGDQTSSSADPSLANGNHHPSHFAKAEDDAPESLTRASTASTTSDEQDQAAAEDLSSFYPFILRFLPVEIECSRGAISLGNEGTRALVVSTFTKAKGHIDAACADATDIYRQVFDFDIEHPVVQMRPNPDYRRPQHALAEHIIQTLDTPTAPTSRLRRIFRSFRPKRQNAAYLHLKKLIPGFRASTDSFLPHAASSREPSPSAAVDGSNAEASTIWHGLDRYLDEDVDDHEAWAHTDYARFSTILDSPAIHFTFYWDEPGKVTAEDLSLGHHSNDVNGSQPPAYGMRLVIKGGDVNYGPWADRLRAEVQSAFFPAPYMSSVPAEKLKPGDTRQYSRMIIDVEVEEDVSVRVPTREESKDWQWRGRAQAARDAAIRGKQHEKKHFGFRRTSKPVHGNNVRPFAWFNFTLGKGSTVRYESAMLPDSTGYPNSLHMKLKDTRVTSSVNHALLWRCPMHKIDADLSYPPGWNDRHRWTFNVQSDQLDMFILRDHMFLLVDLISDFTVGQKPDFMTFVPFHYQIGLVFNDLKLYLNTNDSNIIDKPNDLDENAFLVLGFGRLNGTVGIPLEYYAPRQSEVTFQGDGTNAFLDLSTPKWSTLDTFLHDPMIPDLPRLLALKDLSLDGSYNYWTSTAPNQTDSLFMNITGLDPRIHLHGYLIRYFLNLKDNYFGDNLHFRTLEEYKDLLSDPEKAARVNQRPLKKENDLDVILTVRADRLTLLIPANIYTRRRGIRADILQVEADMRFTNYYMDLQVNSSPIECALETIRSVGESPDVTNCQLFVESVAVVGHRLFGAPPAEPAYAGHWDIDLGFVSGQISSSFLQTLISAVQSLTFALDDSENALPAVFVEPCYDVNFVRARAAGLRVWLLSDQAAFVVDLDPLTVNFDDWAGEHFATHVDVSLPAISLGAVDLKTALRHHEDKAKRPNTFALFKTSVRLAVLDKSKDLAETRALQQHHIKYHDQRTHRIDALLRHNNTTHGHVHRPPRTPAWAQDDPYMPLPEFPWPFADQAKSRASRPQRIRSKSSFLSVGSGSVRQRVRPQGNAAAPPRNSSFNPSERPRQSTKFSSVVHASPWATPYFPLQDITLDDSDLPEMPARSSTTQTRHAEDEGLDGVESEQAKDVAHMGLLCLLENGLVGFCTPAFISSIATLVKELQPSDTLDLMDTVQRDVIDLVVKRYAPKNPSQDLDVGVRVPAARIRLKHSNDVAAEKAGISTFNDHHDISIDDGHADCRLQTRNAPDSATPLPPTTMLVHTSVRNLGVSVSDNAVDSASPAYSSLTLSDIGIWFSSARVLKGTVQVNSTVGEIGAAQIRPMAALLHRTTDLIESVAANFVGLNDSSHASHLVYHLTERAATAPDPAFLTRPSYVLRTAARHTRTTESWKIFARLRNTFELAKTQHALPSPADCACWNEESDDDRRKQMLKAFDKWLTWDGAPKNQIPVVAALFGQDMKLDGTDAGPNPLQLELLLGHVAVILDPGLHQTALSFNGVATDIFLDPAGQQSESDDAPTKLSIQSHTSDIDLTLDWALVELAANLLDIIQTSGSRDAAAAAAAAPTETASPDVPKAPLLVELVIGADLASISANSANLRLKSGFELLRTSVFLVPGKHGSVTPIFSVAATTAMLKVDGPQRSLLGWKLSGPKVCGSVIPPDAASATPGTIEIGAACDKLRFALREDIPAIMRVAQRLVDGEVAEAYNRFSHIQLPKKAAAPAAVTSEPSHTDFHLAMFLDDFKLDLLLLPALRYAIKGRVARSCVTPRGMGKFAINFDLDQQEHSLRGIWANSFESPAVLRIPPINGRVSVVNLADVTTLRAHATIDLIEFEASAVRACFDVINQPGSLDAIKSIQGDVDNIQSSATRIFGQREHSIETANKPDTSVFRFAADATLAGIKIHCVAPNSRQGESEAHLEFWLGPTAVKVSNIIQGSIKVYERPQFNVAVHDVGLGLYRKARYRGRISHGRVALALRMSGTTETDARGNSIHVYHVSSSGINVDLFQETAALVVDIATFLQARLKSITIPEQAKTFKPIRRLTMAGSEAPKLSLLDGQDVDHSSSTESDDAKSSNFFDSVISVNVDLVRLRWGLNEETMPISPGRALEDLVFSIRKIELRTRQEGSARLSIHDLQLQLVPHGQDLIKRTANSALLPEVIFSSAYLSTRRDRRFAFQAKGKALDLRLAADFVVPAAQVRRSLATAISELRAAKGRLSSSAATPDAKQTTGSILGSKRLASLLVDADFAGAIVHVSPRQQQEQRSSVFGMLKGPKRSRAGRYHQAVHGEGSDEATLQAPGVAIKVKYDGNGQDDPTLSTEIKVAASSNTLYPSVVPLLLDISSSIKEILGEAEPTSSSQKEEEEEKEEEDSGQTASKYISDATMNGGDPTAILGPTKLIAKLWVQKQEFSLSCQPIARVSATARFEDIFLVVNTVQGPDVNRFFSVLTTFNKLQASVQHVYSRDSTASFDVESIVLSLMNSKHVSGTTGISAILKMSPVKTQLNAKQMQDFLLFREIWYPAEARGKSKEPVPQQPPPTAETQAFAIQKYQQMTVGQGTLPWNAIISIQEVKIQVDWGPALGKSTFNIHNFWVSSKKNSDAEQNLCVGFDRVGVDSTGRLSGFVELQNFRVRSGIRWPADDDDDHDHDHDRDDTASATSDRAPLVQASVGFDHLRVKVAFDYQPFVVADVSYFEPLMYNVRGSGGRANDRLVAILNGGKIQVFCTALAGAQGLALFQAFEKLVEEKRETYRESLQELDKFLRRKSIFPTAPSTSAAPVETSLTTTAAVAAARTPVAPIEEGFSLHTDVVVSLKAIDLGVFPSTFYDNQIVKVATINAQARFAVATTEHRTHSILGMRLGEVRVALASVSQPTTKALDDVSVDGVIERATTARGGTILKVPRLVSSMQTWQTYHSNVIEYIFRSSFEGKVDVGWNYARIAFIRDMWQAHSRAMAQRLGKPLPESAVKITAEPASKDGGGGGKEKITAVVNMPTSSKYTYVALEPPIIDTPQLRDMGEATPPLEWIGLHRDRLPEATHNVAIVSLLEVAREVEDAYVRILGRAGAGKVI